MEDVQRVSRRCQGEPRQDQLWLASRRDHAVYRDAADREATRRPVDARTRQELCRIEQCASGRPYPRGVGCGGLGTASKLWSTPVVGELWTETDQELAGCADTARGWSRRDCKRRLRYRGAKRHES